MKTTQELFKEVLEDLGFAGYKPSEMSNSDYWLCTNTAMQKYADQQLAIQRVSQQRELLIDFAETYQNCHLDDTAENTVDWYLRVKDN
jgi:hypothetical protein